MFRLIGLILDLSIPLMLYFEVFRPLWKSRGVFPCTRWVLRMSWGVIKLLTSKPTHVVNSEVRRKQAEERLRAAERDKEAALLEAASLELEDEANDIRMGKIKVKVPTRK